jgi:hypothetical protein
MPILPVKHQISGDDRLIYPLGTFRGCWYSEEIQYAMELDIRLNSSVRGFTLKNILFSRLYQ